MSTSDLASFSAIPVRGGDAYIFTLPKGTTPQSCSAFARRFERAFGHLEPGPVAFVVTEDVGVRWVEHMAMEQVAVVVDAWREENAKVDALEGRTPVTIPVTRDLYEDGASPEQQRLTAVRRAMAGGGDAGA